MLRFFIKYVYEVNDMILVTGAKGFVGARLMKDMENVIAAPSLRGMTEDDVKRMVQESGADTIIHTAAISDIPTCEQDPEASYTANVLLPVYLAKAAQGRKLICFSSDQVYSGCDAEGPYAEDTVKPANTYARHKLEMEQRVLDICPDAVLLRAEWMYDMISPRGNYIKNVLAAQESVAFSSLQYRGVTYLKEVAENMSAVCRLPGGAYNFGSETERNMFDITRDFVKLLGKNIEVIDSQRPSHNLWMNCKKAASGGVIFSSVDAALKRCAEDYGLI